MNIRVRDMIYYSQGIWDPDNALSRGYLMSITDKIYVYRCMQLVECDFIQKGIRIDPIYFNTVYLLFLADVTNRKNNMNHQPCDSEAEQSSKIHKLLFVM